MSARLVDATLSSTMRRIRSVILRLRRRHKAFRVLHILASVLLARSRDYNSTVLLLGLYIPRPIINTMLELARSFLFSVGRVSPSLKCEARGSFTLAIRNAEQCKTPRLQVFPPSFSPSFSLEIY